MVYFWKHLLIILSVLLKSFLVRDCWVIWLSDATYEDIASLNATCKGSDSCEFHRKEDTLEHYNCNCGSSCSLLGTCCVDSKYKYKYPESAKNIECKQFYNSKDKKNRFYPMIQSCDPDVQSDKTTEKFCNSYSYGDPFLQIPVTDLETGITYKNYYCYACNGNYGKERVIPWNLNLMSKSENIIRPSLQSLHFDESRYTWVVDYGEENATDITLGTSMPEELKKVVPFCFNVRITSDCASDWTDKKIRYMCQAYMALTRIQKVEGFYSYKDYYRNPHCAICNYESLENMLCFRKNENLVPYSGRSGDFFIGLFYLHREGDSKCEDNLVYDYFSKKCRKVFRLRKRAS